MKTFSEFVTEKATLKFKKGDVILNHLGKEPFKEITIEDIKNNQYITDNGKIDVKFQDSYKLKEK